MDTNYKLIHSVDPTKCRTKIRDKFAKLTLSSNKKKQQDAEMQRQIRDQALHSHASRNLLLDLLTDDESDGEKEQQQHPTENLLMRTDSSPSDDNVAPKKPPLDNTDTTHCSEVEQGREKSLEMERLLVSELENTETKENFAEIIETLSSRVSSLAVGANPSGEVSRIVSTENQRICDRQRFSDLLKSQESKKEPETSMNISLSSSEDSVITISDSSGDEEEYKVNVSPTVATNIPPSLDTVKADRMAAFLRDVRRNYGLPVDTPEQNFSKRQKEIASADTEPMTTESDSRSAGTAKRIATADTESMTPEKETTARNPPATPKATPSRKHALDDTKDMTKADETMQSPPHYAPVINVGTEFLDDSIHKSSTSIPDDSLTIEATSEEEESSKEESEPPQPETERALTRSNSLSQRLSKESSESSGRDTPFHINISAKINIKIHVSQQQEDSSTSHSSTPSHDNDRSENCSADELPHCSAQRAQNRSNALEDIPHSPPERDVPEEGPEILNQTPEDFMEKAQRLLDELYGDSWKTPEVVRSLKKACPRRKRTPGPITEPKVPEPEIEPKDDTAVDDFSIFRRNIAQDLDSTRLPSPPVSTFKVPRSVAIESKGTSQLQKIDEQEETPRTEITRTKSGREVRPRWRALVDSDTESEGENASGDNSWGQSDKDDDDDEEVENIRPSRKKGAKLKTNLSRSKNADGLVYLDLSKGEVEVQHDVSTSPPANHDEKFNRRLEEILKTCKYEDKPKLQTDTPSGRTKRKLFTANLEEDMDNFVPPFDSPKEWLQNADKDEGIVTISKTPMPAKFEPFNKYLESVKTGQPIFKIQTPKTRRDLGQQPPESSIPAVPKTPKTASKEAMAVGDLCNTPKDKYGFLRSLDVRVGKSLCHPDALYYRDNFRQKRDELAQKLYEIYNEKCFDGELDIPIRWNKKLTNTAGRCMNKKRLGERSCVIELSEKVLTSADRLRCTLIHELCHAVTWIKSGEGGHGATWKAWARKANQVFPELPKIGVCHQYDIEYKYTYKCTLCGAKSHAHSKSKKVENIRCSYCHGAIEVYLNRKDKDGNQIATPVREPTGFAKFVKDKYKDFKRPDLKHADIMKLLSNEFASMKVNGKL